MRTLARHSDTTAKASASNATGRWNDILALQGREREFVWPDLSQYTNQADVYTKSPFVYKAISLVADAAASGEFEAFQLVGEKKEAIQNHPIELLLRKPNGWQSGQEFLKAVYTDYLINGNVYTYLASENGGPPDEMMLLQPDRVRIVPNSNNIPNAAGKILPVRGYVYTVNSVEIPLEASQVIHWKEHNPRDPFYGLSRLQVVALSIQAEQSMARWQRNFFSKDNAVPAGLVSIKNTVTDFDYERIMRDWKRSYGGVNRATAFIRGDVSYSNMGATHVDMDFLQGRQFEKELIFLTFNVPPGMLDKNSTEANAQAGLEVLTNFAVWPLMTGLGSKLSNELCPFWGDDIVVEPEDIRVKDKAAERDQMYAESAFMEINEIRGKYLNLPPVNWGDIPAAGAGAAAITGAPISNKPTAVPKQVVRDAADIADANQEAAAQKALKAVEPAVITRTIDVVSRVYVSRAMQREIEQFTKRSKKGADAVDSFKFNSVPPGLGIALKALADTNALDTLTFKAKTTPRVSITGEYDPNAKAKDKYEREFTSAYAEQLAYVQKRVIDVVRHQTRAAKTKLPDDPSIYTDAMDDEWWADINDHLSKALQPIVQDAIETGMTDGYDVLQMRGLGVELDPTKFNIDAAKYAQDWTDSWLAEFGTTTQQGVGALIARWVGTPGATLEDLVSAIQESHAFSKSRAQMTAVTEVTRAFAQAEYGLAEDLADVADVDLSVGMSDYADMIPAHPNCRCWSVMQFQYDANGKITSIDFVWRTANDDVVCQVCGPRNGKLMSEVAA